MKQKGDIQGLNKLLKKEKELVYRFDAAEALAQLGDENGLIYLINALDDSDKEVRGIAKEILQGLNDPRGNRALNQPHKPPRKQTARNKENLTPWYAVKVGLAVGVAVILISFVIIILLWDIYMDSHPVIVTILWTWPGFVFGIVGALIGKYMKEASASITVGAVIGAITGIGGWLIFIEYIGVLL